MAYTFLMVQASTPIYFNAVPDGYKQPDALKITELVALNGTVYRYKWGHTYRAEITLNNVSYADATFFNTWWEYQQRIHFTPDLINAAGVTFSARIVNTNRPFQMFNYGFRDKYAGTMIVQQVPSGS